MQRRPAYTVLHPAKKIPSMFSRIHTLDVDKTLIREAIARQTNTKRSLPSDSLSPQMARTQSDCQSHPKHLSMQNQDSPRLLRGMWQCSLTACESVDVVVMSTIFAYEHKKLGHVLKASGFKLA